MLLWSALQGARSISIEIDTRVDPPVLVVEVAGVSKRASNALDKDDYNFIAVTKTNGEIAIWLGLKGSLVKDSTFDLGGATYGISDTEAIFLVQPGASKAQISHGWVGKMNFNTAQKWGDVAHAAKDYPLWDNYIENNMWTVSFPCSPIKRIRYRCQLVCGGIECYLHGQTCSVLIHLCIDLLRRLIYGFHT